MRFCQHLPKSHSPPPNLWRKRQKYFKFIVVASSDNRMVPWKAQVCSSNRKHFSRGSETLATSAKISLPPLTSGGKGRNISNSLWWHLQTTGWYPGRHKSVVQTGSILAGGVRLWQHLPKSHSPPHNFQRKRHNYFKIILVASLDNRMVPWKTQVCSSNREHFSGGIEILATPAKISLL